MEKAFALAILASLTLFNVAFSQAQTFQTTDSGVLYRLYSDKSGPLAEIGNYLKYNMREEVHAGVLLSSYSNTPLYVRVQPLEHKYGISELFNLLRNGDSIVVAMPIDSIRRNYSGQLPSFFQPNDTLFYRIKILAVFTSIPQMEADSVQEVARQRERESAAIETYLAHEQVQIEKTPLGVYVQVDTIGHGPAISTGKQVTLHYTCTAMHQGKIVPSNQPGQVHASLTIVIGKGQVIPGMEDGLRQFREGGKGTMYIPAFLAYDTAFGPGGNTYENLRFEVEIDKVTTVAAGTRK